MTCLALSSCVAEQRDRARGEQDRAGEAQAVVAGDPIPYDLTQPSASFELARELVEISGITMLPDGRIAAVQDEDGIVFVLDPASGTVVEQVQFAGSGDYEGIAWAGDRLFAVVSNGRLFEISQWPRAEPRVDVFRTALRGRNDVEGLAYDAANDRLLLACKEDPGSGLGNDVRAVYGVDLRTRVTSDRPVYVIDQADLERRFGLERTFKPSGIAIHPQTDQIYVISSAAAALVVLDVGGKVRSLAQLSRDIFEQPEGIAFAPDATLYLSSEGVRGPGMLFRFDATSTAAPARPASVTPSP